MKKLNFLILKCAIMFLLVGCSSEEQNNDIQTFKKYYSSVNENNADKWNYTTDTVKLWFDKKEGQPILQVKGKGSTGKWKEWDSIMNSRSRYDSLWYDENEKAVKGLFYENNDFYELIGKSPTKTLQTYWLNENNKIHEILIYWIPEENTTSSEHLSTIVDWALQYDSTEISELYPNGRIVPSKENALRWKKLLKTYNEIHNKNIK